ncbi:MAG TPA: hypothetical protein DCZ93_07270 [Elusimicrobia bacterium]|nr:hypothetical protein [Elusimicrobiota bacterium]
MEIQHKRISLPSLSQLPPYLRKLVLFDRLISGLLWVIIAILAASLAVTAAGGNIGPWFLAGTALLAVCLILNM